MWISVIVCLGAIALPLAAAEKISAPFTYEGYSSPQYAGIEKKSLYVPMSDGEKLAIDAYIPTGGPATSFPVIIEYTPYTRAFIDIKDGPIRKGTRKALLKTDSPVLDMLAVESGMAGVVKVLISHGYVFVRADIRGCGASTGWRADFMPRLGVDGGEMVDWIGVQDWCDGNVGMVGGSYSGYSQIVTAGHAGPALKAIAPVVVPMDGYNGQVYPGGVYCYKFMHDYGKRLGTLNLNYYTLDPIKILFKAKGDMFLPAAPVIDEDNDGYLVDEVPLDLNGNGTFLDDYAYPDDPADEPQYSDGKAREHIYYLATNDHRLNADYHFFAQGLFFEDAQLPPPLTQYRIWDFNPSSQVPKIMNKDVAIYNIGGWHDTFVRGTTEYYATMKDANPSRMLIGPGYHSGGGPYWDYFGEGDVKFLEMLLPELMRYFDFYLKGIDNGFDRDDPIQIYVQNGGGFRAEKEWPLARAQVEEYFFSPGGRLAQSAGSPGSDDHQADLSHDSRYGKTKGNRYLAAMGVTPDELAWRTELDKKCLTYTSAPMSRDLEVTGHPLIHFWVSSSADNGDFFVYLEDVDESGRALLVTEGVHRAGFKTPVDNDEIIMGGGSGIEVLPELPWHGYERADFTNEVFANGSVVELEFDFKPTSWVFRAGHSIRVSIATSDWPTFRLHPRLARDNDANNPANVIPIITVYRDSARPSRIKLPVIPR